METRHQLLERRSLHSCTRPLQLVPDRRRDPALWLDLRFHGALLASRQISPGHNRRRSQHAPHHARASGLDALARPSRWRPFALPSECLRHRVPALQPQGRLLSLVSRPTDDAQSSTHRVRSYRAGTCRRTVALHGLREKVIWGDLADVFHLVYTFSLPGDALRATLAHS